MFCPCFWITPSAQCFGDSGERASSLGKSGGGEQEKNPIPRALQRTCSQTIVAQLSRTLHM